MRFFILCAFNGAAALVQAAACGFTHVDAVSVWTWNLTGLSNHNGDYEATTAGRRIVTNVCRPPVARCAAAMATPTAIATHGASCEPLGWGALGQVGSRWSLIDPFAPREGVRVIHFGLMDGGNMSATNVTFDEYREVLDNHNNSNGSNQLYQDDSLSYGYVRYNLSGFSWESYDEVPFDQIPLFGPQG